MLMPSVLIIEDDEDGRRAVSKLFAQADWKVFEAADGDAGVELALRNRPEVILCDLLPVPGPATIRYGGNTSCVEVRADGEIIVLDAGTGIRRLGLALQKELGPGTIKLTLLITHTHWDHIQGLPFFSPAYNSKNLIRILGYEGARAGLGTILAGQMETPFFPVSLHQLPSHRAIQGLKAMEFQIGKVKVEAKFANHPGICAGYRLFTSAGSVAYMPDNET